MTLSNILCVVVHLRLCLLLFIIYYVVLHKFYFLHTFLFIWLWVSSCYAPFPHSAISFCSLQVTRVLVARFLQRSKRNLAPSSEHAGSTGQGSKRRSVAEGAATNHLPLEQVWPQPLTHLCLSSSLHSVSLSLSNLWFVWIIFRCCGPPGAPTEVTPPITPIVPITVDITIPIVTVDTTGIPITGRQRGSTCAAVEIWASPPQHHYVD